MIPFERQLTSPADQMMTRQVTSPFDIPDVTTAFDDRIKIIGEGRVEITFETLKLIYTATDKTSLYVADGGNDTIRVGDRLEVVDWAQNTGFLMLYTGKPCVAAGSLASNVTDKKAFQSAQRFASKIADVAGVGFGILLKTLAKTADGSSIALWRAQTIAQSIVSPENPLRFQQ